MRIHPFATLALPGLLLVLLAACTTEQDPSADAPAADVPSAAPGTPANYGDAAPAHSPGAAADIRWLPPAQDGALPRTIAGYTQLDPQPEGSTPVQGPVFQAAQQLTTNGPDGQVRVLSLDGRIFRIEHVPTQAVPFADAAAAARSAYGAPSHETRSRIQFGDALKVGDTILEVRSRRDQVEVFIEDAGTSLKAHHASS